MVAARPRRWSIQLLVVTVLGLLWPLAQAVRRLPSEQRRLSSQETSAEEAPRRRLARIVEAKTPDDHLVKNLPGLQDFPTKQWAGMLTSDAANGGRLFYWLFEAAENPDTRPLIIWLNGGPGCSSMDGLFLENGPLKVNGKRQVTANPYSWHKVANTLYVDQPVGTGFSYTNGYHFCENDNCIGGHFYRFLQEFLKLHSSFVDPTTGKSRKIFFSGESHAGHYIPSLVSYILDRNANLQEGDVHLSVEGMAIGNGWIDPWSQYDVSEFAHGVGLISEGQYETLQRINKDCQYALEQGNLYTAKCFNSLDMVIASTGSDARGYVSMYDYRMFDNPGNRNFPPGHREVEAYLNSPGVKDAIHASESPLRFQECTDPPYDALRHQDGLGVLPEISKSLISGVRALFFNGAYDVICNHVGNERALMRLEWPGQKDFINSPRGVWLPRGSEKPGGYSKSDGQLTYLIVLDSGHMVPMDVPSNALEMISRFLENESFQDRSQPISMTASPLSAEVVKVPPQVPTITGVVAGTEEGTALVQFTPSADDTKDGSVYYTVLKDPGGGTVVAVEGDKGLLVTDLRAGVQYTFRLVANNEAGSSKPSPAVTYSLPCQGGLCGQGLCGYDEALEASRCFCFQGFQGIQCDEPVPQEAATTVVNKPIAPAQAPVVEGVASSQEQPSGRVRFTEDESCRGRVGAVQEGGSKKCVLRFTVQMRSWSPPSTYEEVGAVETMLARDMTSLLPTIRREYVHIRSLSLANNMTVVPVAAADGPADLTMVFEMSSVSDVPGTVQIFKKAWEGKVNDDNGGSKSTLGYGFVTSNFNQMEDVVIRLAEAVPIPAMKAGTGLLRDIKIQESMALSFILIALIMVCVALAARWSRKLFTRSGPSTLGRGGRTTNPVEAQNMLPLDDDLSDEQDIELTGGGPIEARTGFTSSR